MTVLHGLSFDIEDWEQNLRLRLLGIESPVSAGIEDQVREVLDVCDEAEVRATFFVVGRVARERPSLVIEIARRGHEIACHSDAHRLVGTLTRSEFSDDTRCAKARLEDITGAAVIGYRAPEFSVGALDHFCFEVLAELGFRYDSSVFPVRGPRYGIPAAPRWPFELATPAGELVELPLLTLRLFDVNLPVAGGTYYRVFPRRVLAASVARAEREGGTAILYFHPYEFSRSVLWLHGDGLSNLRAARHILSHNFRTRRIRQRLSYVMHRHRFGRLAEIVQRRAQGLEKHTQGADLS